MIGARVVLESLTLGPCETAEEFAGKAERRPPEPSGESEEDVSVTFVDALR